MLFFAAYWSVIRRILIGLLFLISGITVSEVFCISISPSDSQNTVLLTDSLPWSKSTEYNIPLADTTIHEVSDSTDQSSRFKSLKEKLLMELTGSGTSVPATKNAADQLNNGYSRYQGKTIRNIRFRQLEIFGPTIQDTAKMPAQWFERLGNGLHVHTQDFILKNRLLMNKGDEFDAYQISENERIIREMPSIDDAVIIVTEAPGDSVDLLFVTKDVFPIGASIEILDVLYGRASFSNQNIMGLGHEFNYRLVWNDDSIPLYGHKFRYSIPNISNTFFSAEASYENHWHLEAFKFKLNRQFYSSSTKYAGGIGFEKILSLRNVLFPDTVLTGVEVDYNFYDLWAGRSINLPRLSNPKLKTSLVVAARINRYEFYKRPEVNESLLYNFHERIIYLGSAGIARQGFKKSRFIYGYGRTEDVPFGMALTLTGGFEDNEFFNRPYIGLRGHWASKLSIKGRVSVGLDYGTFLNSGTEQGLLEAYLHYISPLANPVGRYKYRFFTKINYSSGYNRFEDEFLIFDNDEGIRGLESIDLRGNQRMSINLEANCYSQHIPLGFRFVYYAFIDAGVVSNRNPTLLKNQLYSGVGIGVKIRNENLVFNSVMLRLAYYPVLPDGASAEYIKLTSFIDPKFQNFFIQEPEITPYQIR